MRRSLSRCALLVASVAPLCGACSPAAAPPRPPVEGAPAASLEPLATGDAGLADAETQPVSAIDASAGSPKPIVRLPAGLVALAHVLLFDGTLAPPKADQVVVLDHGKIASVGPASAFVATPGMTVLDLSGHAVLPGLVGMHNHLYYIALAGGSEDEVTPLLPELFFSAPRLYLAGGVTTMRTTGSVEPYADLSLRRMIDEGTTPGPEIDVTAPYLEGPHGFFPQMPVVKTAAEARRFVAFWAAQGATSVKAYMHISRDALRAAIEEAHHRGIKVTGHLCSVTYAEAAAMGIDDLEHGFFASTDFAPGKKPDECAPYRVRSTILTLDPESTQVRELVRTLVSHHVALTSTLPVFEQRLPGCPAEPRGIALLEPILKARYGEARKEIDAAPNPAYVAAYQDDLKLERAFVQAGGLLLTGPDPTGNGGIIPGFADQRGVELLVDAGFSPVEAIHIATYNGAAYLGRLDRIGTVAAGKQADVIVVRGDPGARIKDIENVEWVFKKGVGYDPQALIEAVRGTVGLY